jgi:TolA-binding protein
MSLDGLRAWIGVVERKLTMRTRVFLVLVAIAIGGAAAGIVLAIDAQDNSVSKDDLKSVRDELAGTSSPVEAPQTSELEAQIETLRGEIATLRNESETGGAASPEDAKRPAESGSGGASAPENQQQLKEAAEEAIEKSQGDHK